MPTFDAHETLRFGDFELDLAAYELRCRGRAVKLERRPMDLLILLVEKRRQLVSRSDIVDRLWGKDVFVDVETGVNTAISKVRQALRDSAETPSFVETIPGKGIGSSHQSRSFPARVVHGLRLHRESFSRCCPSKT